MPKREDEELEIMAGLSAKRDDGAATRKPTSAANPAPSAKAAAASPRGSVGRWLTWLIILLLIAVCGWLGQQVLQLQQRAADTDSAIHLTRSRLDELGVQVYATGSSFSETGNVIEEKFRFFDSEIRKLWDVSNKRNKKRIADNTEQTKKLSTQVSQLSSQTKSLVNTQTKADNALKQLNSELTAENTSLRAALEQQNNQLLVLRGELELMQTRLQDLPANVGRRLKSNEEAIEAIDAARRQLISSVTQLQNRVNQLQQQNPGTP